MADIKTPDGGPISGDQIEKNFQSHINKIMPLITRVEVELATNPNLSVEQLMEYYKQQQTLEGIISWCIILEKRYNPSKIIPVRG